MLPKRFQTVLLFALSFLAAGLLPLYYSIKYGPAAALTSFAGDAFYYLGIAQRSQHFHGFTFDRLYQTNGFHPLWEWLLTALAHIGVLSFADPLSLVLRVYRADILLLALASAIFCIAAASLLSRPALALLVSAPGPLWIAVALALPGNGASWSAANGMESALTWFFFSLALATLLVRGERNALPLNLLVSVLLGCTVLARLDEIFLAFSILLTLCLAARTGPRAYRHIAALCLPFVSMLAAYLAYNRTAVGAFLPLSGTAKAGLAGWYNLHQLAWLLLPVFRGDPPTALQAGIGYSTFDETYMRMAQMLLPMLVCLTDLLRTRRRTSSTARLLHALYAGVILKALYNFIFVAMYHQGSWYYTISIAIADFVLVRWLDEALQHLLPRALPVAQRCAVVTLYLCAVMLAFNLYLVPLKRSYGADYLELFRSGQALGNDLRHEGYTRILEFTDGAISFALDMPAESAFGLALDAEATTALKRHDFLETMERRNVHLIATQNVYGAVIGAYLANKTWETGQSLFAIDATEFNHYTFVFLRHDAAHNIDFYRLVHR